MNHHHATSSGMGPNAMMPHSSMGNGGNIMDSLKNNLMTMLMFKSMNGSKDGSNASSSQDMFYMMYVFIITQLVDLFIKYLPIIIHATRTKYFSKLEDPILKKLSHVAADITDEAQTVKTKTSSIVIHVGVTDHENAIGQALLDHITNHNNTKHIKYTKQNFILNENEAICIDDDIFVVMTESETQQTDEADGKTTPQQNMLIQMFEIFSFVKSTKQLRDFLTKLRHDYVIATQNKLGTKRFFFNMQPIVAPRMQGTKSGEVISDYSKLPPYFAFTMKEFQTNRKFSNLFGAEIVAIRLRVQFFLKNRKWYDEKGVPYTLGLLLSGAPGTGKTSCIKCLANETNRHIVNINLNSDITKTQLENLFFNESIVILNPFTRQNEKYNIPLDQRIYVLEDIDCQGDVVLDRGLTQMQADPQPFDSGGPGFGSGSGITAGFGSMLQSAAPAVPPPPPANSNSDKMDMSFLLNLLDGVLETPGRIIIMTSNYPDLLDKALIRPGRIDIISKFKKCCNQTIVDMMEFFYNITLTESQKTEIHHLANEIITPAELSKIMFENFGQPNLAIASMVKTMTLLTVSDLVEVEAEPSVEDGNKDDDDDDDDDAMPKLVPINNSVKKEPTNNNYMEWKEMQENDEYEM